MNMVYVENHAVIRPLLDPPLWDPLATNPAPELAIGGWLK